MKTICLSMKVIAFLKSSSSKTYELSGSLFVILSLQELRKHKFYLRTLITITT